MIFYHCLSIGICPTLQLSLHTLLQGGKAGLFTGLVAPVLYHGFLYFLGVCSGPGADLLGYIHALLHLLQVTRGVRKDD